MTMDGIVILNKPSGHTSMDCCAIVRRLSGEKKVGHAGTLDPNATGVLPICLGKAARLIEYMDKTSKRYRCSFQLGLTTDTQDIWGSVISENSSVSFPAADKVKETLSGFMGDILQIPPKYSAIKINGRKLYSYARNGEEIEVRPRPVTVYSLVLLSYDQLKGSGIFDVECSKGTYIRTICHDLGIRLGTGACLSGLVRTESCGFDLSEAVSLDDIKEQGVNAFLLPAVKAVSSYPRVNFSVRQASFFQNGVNSFSSEYAEQDEADILYAAFCEDSFLGMAQLISKGVFKPKKVFK